MTLQQEADPLPMPYTHACDVYEAMKKASRLEKDENKRPIVVWEGFMTHLFKSLDLATPAYTSILTHLKRMGCISQLRRGGSTTKSMWELVKPPSEDDFRDSLDRAPKTTKIAMLEQRIDGLATRLGKLEAALLDGGVQL